MITRDEVDERIRAWQAARAQMAETDVACPAEVMVDGEPCIECMHEDDDL